MGPYRWTSEDYRRQAMAWFRVAVKLEREGFLAQDVLTRASSLMEQAARSSAEEEERVYGAPS